VRLAVGHHHPFRPAAHQHREPIVALERLVERCRVASQQLPCTLAEGALDPRFVEVAHGRLEPVTTGDREPVGHRGRTDRLRCPV
jgi:hypothetical protein